MGTYNTKRVDSALSGPVIHLRVDKGQILFERSPRDKCGSSHLAFLPYNLQN